MTISRTKSVIPNRPPDQVNIYQVKKVSGKYSWTEHKSAESADKQTKRTNNGWYWKTHGRLWRFRYRINIYLKNQDERNPKPTDNANREYDLRNRQVVRERASTRY